MATSSIISPAPIKRMLRSEMEGKICSAILTDAEAIETEFFTDSGIGAHFFGNGKGFLKQGVLSGY